MSAKETLVLQNTLSKQMVDYSRGVRSFTAKSEKPTSAQMAEMQSSIEMLQNQQIAINTTLENLQTQPTLTSAQLLRVQTARAEFESLNQTLANAIERLSLFSEHVTLDMDNLIRERGSINASNALADSLTEQALAARANIAQQEAKLGKTRSTMFNLRGLIDTSSVTMGKIKSKKQRNSFILWTVFAFCVCFLIWWVFG